MQALTDLLALALWLTHCSYDYSWAWGQQHTLLNHDKQLRYSVTTYPQGQRVWEVKHKGQTVFQGVME